MAVLARLVTGYPRTVAAAAALLTVLAGLKIRHFGHDQLEYDFSRLRRRDTWTRGRRLLGREDGLRCSAAT